jgi:signal transduction histidine kinase
MRTWFQSGSIRRQITALAIGPVILVALLAIVTQPLTPNVYESTSYAETTAIRIETVVEQVRVSDAPAQIAAVLDAVSKTGLRVEIVSAAELNGSPQKAVADGDVRELVRGNLPASLHAVLRGTTRDGALSDVIVVQVDGDTALAFAPALGSPDALISHKQVNFILKALVVILPVMLSSFYAGRMITAPLTRFADAAQSLDPDEGQDRPFEEGGSLEMRKLATSLNDMRGRIRDMLNDRTRMLRAISHDLRTPLTRLRLRAERSAQPDLRGAMLNDIKRIDEMIDETLTFLSKDVSAEEPVNADLPSLLQTVCADFADIDFATTYDGPDRFTYPCKPRALARAISNLVDNGTKFANVVIVRLVVHATGAVQIMVADDGPGVAEELRRKVLEPFFKGSAARTATDGGGFGLGLSIVNDIVRSHGGSMRLLDGNSGGLTVSVDLPAVVRDASKMVRG